MSYRYYTTQRPPAPGAIPRGATDVCDWDSKDYAPEINQHAWGYAEYDRELTADEVDRYELVPGKYRRTEND